MAAEAQVEKSNIDLMEAKEEKKIDPFKDLEKSTMNLNICKNDFCVCRQEGTNYFNETFWTQFDYAGYTAHLGKYKYNDELGPMEFIRSNKINGIIQLMENPFAHKYMFGTFNLFKCESCHELEVVFFTRGSNIIEETFSNKMHDFDWAQLDLNDESVQQYISTMFHCDVETKFDNKTIEYHQVYM